MLMARLSSSSLSDVPGNSNVELHENAEAIEREYPLRNIERANAIYIDVEGPEKSYEGHT